MKRLISILMIGLLAGTASAKDQKGSGAYGGAAKLNIIKMNGDGGKNIVEIAVGSSDHKTLVTAVKATGLVETLTGPGPYTLFAPTDAAFAKLPKGTVEGLLKPDKIPTLKSILEHHAAAPAFNPDVLALQSELDMVDGPKLKIENKGGKLTVEGVELKTVILATNGIVYVVDTVLLPK